MISYIQFSVIPLGPIPIQVWGLFVALGILTGAFVAARKAEQRGLQAEVVYDASFWTMIGAFVGARIVHLLYAPAYYWAHPLEILAVWHGGFSVMGGFIGAALCGIWYLRRRQVDVYAYADTMVFGLPLGLGIGRLGCFLIHDHPGTLTDFVLGVRYPDGVRHDHGLYLSINGFVLFLVFLLLSYKKARTGTYLVVFLLWYGVVRFFLDFLRADDTFFRESRYLSLTPAQYGCLLMVGGGIWLWQWQRSRKKLADKSA